MSESVEFPNVLNHLLTPENQDTFYDLLEVSHQRLPSHVLAVEQAVLGTAINNPDMLGHVNLGISKPDLFYLKAHQLIARVIFKFMQESRKIDVTILSNQLSNEGQLEAIGGMNYLYELTASSIEKESLELLEEYSRILKDRYLLREIYHIGKRICDISRSNKGLSGAEILDKVQKMVFEISDCSAVQKRARHIKEINDQIIAALRSDKESYGLATGFTKFDNMLNGGLQMGDLIIIAGRPSMGKTTFAMNIAQQVALNSLNKFEMYRNENPDMTVEEIYEREKNMDSVLIYSLEMSSEQLAKRFIASTGKIQLSEINNFELFDASWDRLRATINKLEGAQIFIDESNVLDVIEIRRRSREFAMGHKLSLIVVDYLQLINAAGGYSSNFNRVNLVGEISRSLKSLARELDIPIIVLSQLNRAVEARSNRIPMMSDLRDSGAIEQDADLILMMYRDEYYNPASDKKGIADIIISKYRNGSTGVFHLRFNGQYTLFENLEEDYDSTFDNGDFNEY